PAVYQKRIFYTVVSDENPRTAHHETTAGLAVARHLVALLIGNLHIDAIDRPSLTGLAAELRLRRKHADIARRLRRRSAGACLCHAPDVVHRNTEALKPFDQAGRRRRTGDDD